MSQVSKSTAKNKHLQLISSGEVDRGPRYSRSSLSSLAPIKSTFTRRAAPSPVVTTYKAAAMQTNVDKVVHSGNLDAAPEIWMETVTPALFHNFQTKIYPIVERIVNHPDHANHPFTIKWQKLCSNIHKHPMTASISWRSLKSLLDLDDIFHYKEFLQQCPQIDAYIKFSPSQTTKNGFDFGLYERTPDDCDIELNTLTTDSPSIDSPSTIGTESYVIDFNDLKPPAEPVGVIPINKDDQSSETRLRYENSVGADEPTMLTPKQTNVNHLPQIVSVSGTGEVVTNPSSNTSVPSKETIHPENLDIAWSITDESPGFRQVHYRLFESVTTWYQQDGAKQHPFYVKWRKALYTGLEATTPWKRVAKILNLEYVKDYITFMKECPRIQERYDLMWDYFDNAIRYQELELPETHHMNRIATYATNTLHSFKTDIQDATEQQLLIYSENIATLHQTSYDRMEAKLAQMEQKLKEQAELLETKFYQRFDEAMEVGIQEIHECVDDATDKFNTHVSDVIKDTNTGAPADAPTAFPRHPKFQNVDPEYAAKVMNFVPTSNPYEETHQNKQVQPNPNNPAASEPQQMSNSPTHNNVNAATTQWGKDGPDFQPMPRPPITSHWYPGQHNHYQSTTDGLPMVQHNEFLKRVSMVYPGREQSYTWYLQLKSASQQYGIYLIPMESFQKDKSLCPTEIYGIAIQPSRYHDMKNSIYQYLAQTSIISIDHYDIRNIINRNALYTDGYRVLYDIMARIHPALDPDATFSVPVATDYADIHEYYLYVDSYIMHEQFSGRQYSPRERLNIFLRGLGDQYHAAIARARQLMDGRHANDNTVPEILELPNLPNLIEKYMEEHGGKPTVRRIQGRQPRHQHNPHTDKQTLIKSEASTRKFLDVKCPLCQSYGHHKTQCDRMAIWLNLKAASKTVDDKLRATIATNYAKIEAERRSKKMARLKGTVRQLYSEGQYQAGDKLLEDYMGDHNGDNVQSQELWIPEDKQTSDTDESHLE